MFNEMGKSVSVIIPSLNEAGCIGAVLNSIPKNLVDEILVVDGHSTDGTPDVVRALGHRVITQEGKGFGSALMTGMREARGDIVAIMDGDGSYEVKDLPKLIAMVQNGNDFAFGSRYAKGSGSKDDTFIRFIGNKIFTFLLRSMHGIRLSDALFLYVVAKKKAVLDLNLVEPGFEYCVELPIKAHRAGFRYAEIPSFEKAREAGRSKVHAVKDGFRILRVMVKLLFRSGARKN